MTNQNRDKLLALFSKHVDQFVSGQEIAEQLGISRAAIWKHMENLRKEGFQIEAVRNKGYRLAKFGTLFSKDSLLLGLETEFTGRTLYFYEEVASTQLIAHEKVNSGAPEGTAIVADFQNAGKGRLRRDWLSSRGEGIFTSIILKPDIPITEVPQLTFIASLAVVETVQKLMGLEARIKWPNDIYIGKRKICGVLTEMQAEAETIHAVIIGIGINVNQASFPDELKQKATSLRMEAGKVFSRTEIVQEIFKQLEKYYKLYLEQGFAPIKLLWEEQAIPFSERIQVRTLKGTITGRAEGISDTGVLFVRDDEGKQHSVYSADIEFEN
ncbi:biotin--[acetyl-CoA-carboxylase] ligase [Listeria aquatica]|uniref:biotin--[acetyl-CoA-carboxylase] ligase n=1 Tax=Listeria aquatica TaxID=1494960 RepID=UPI003F713C37